METSRIEITSAGRSGDVFYREGKAVLNFWWEFSSDGAIIKIPSDGEWKVFFGKSQTEFSIERKNEIIRLVAEETKRQKAASATIVITEDWINLYF